MGRGLQLTLAVLLLLLQDAASAADERVVTRVVVQASDPFLANVHLAMTNFLRESPVVRLVAPNDDTAQQEVLLDGAAAEGSRGQDGAVVLIANVRCRNGPQLYVLHHVGMCGGLLGAAGCGTEFGKSVQNSALMIQRKKAQLAFCLEPFPR